MSYEIRKDLTSTAAKIIAAGPLKKLLTESFSALFNVRSLAELGLVDGPLVRDTTAELLKIARDERNLQTAMTFLTHASELIGYLRGLKENTADLREPLEAVLRAKIREPGGYSLWDGEAGSKSASSIMMLDEISDELAAKILIHLIRENLPHINSYAMFILERIARMAVKPQELRDAVWANAELADFANPEQPDYNGDLGRRIGR